MILARLPILRGLHLRNLQVSDRDFDSWPHIGGTFPPHLVVLGVFVKRTPYKKAQVL